MRSSIAVLIAFSFSMPLLCAQEHTPLGGQAQTTEIHIRLLNGKTGTPIGNKQIFFDRTARLLSHAEDKDIITGADGVATAIVPTSGYMLDPFVVDLHLCTKAERVSGKKDKVVRFSLPTILTSGMVAFNSCGKLTQAAKPGELVLWVRPMNALERITD